MPTPAEDFDTTLREVLCDRICGETIGTVEASTLTTMDGYWASMSSPEKQKVVDYFTSATAPGARMLTGNTHFPKACASTPATFTGISTRYTL